MDLNKAEQLQLLLDLTAESVNELALSVDLEQVSAIDIFEQAVSDALKEYQFVTKKKKQKMIVGKVDTEKMAFCLQDNETTAILQGSADFMEETEFDTVGGEELDWDGEF